MARRPVFIARQGRRPSGVLGRLVAHIMSRETASDNSKAVDLLDVRPSDHVLDVGTGLGATLGLIAARTPNGVATGIDYSDVMLDIATKRHRRLIGQGRVRVECAASDKLPFPDAAFDKAVTMHTLYFWDPAEPHFREIARVLKPDGTFVIGFRPAEDAAVVERFPSSVYRFRTTGEAMDLLASAQFEIRKEERRDAPGNSFVWLVAGRRQ
jgi:ubiquinone/menaquinone biosynthesis C-methylase UbiE